MGVEGRSVGWSDSRVAYLPHHGIVGRYRRAEWGVGSEVLEVARPGEELAGFDVAFRYAHKLEGMAWDVDGQVV